MVNQPKEDSSSDEPDVEMGNLGPIKDDAVSSATAAKDLGLDRDPSPQTQVQSLKETSLPEQLKSIASITWMKEKK